MENSQILLQNFTKFLIAKDAELLQRVSPLFTKGENEVSIGSFAKEGTDYSEEDWAKFSAYWKEFQKNP